MTYRDMTFCAAKDCTNMKCKRNYKHIPWHLLPKWMPVSISPFQDRCEDYTKKEDK